MALFQHDNRSISYRAEFAPFPFDLILLQGSRFNSDFFNPAIEWLHDQPAAGGRVLVCDWFDSANSDEQTVSHFVKLVQTLGLHEIRIIAFDDAVEMAAEAQRLHPGIFEKTRFFPAGGPKGADLERLISDFCELS